MPVRILDEHLINKIAAGEVVERPASVLKELLENALDAGATDIRVHLRAGGRNLVRVVDNGSGMNRTDALMCTERHATSKIRTDADLFEVHTLGFRGEAIPSIASVSRFTLITRENPQATANAEPATNAGSANGAAASLGPPRDAGSDDIGTCIEMEGGRMLDVRDAGCAPGTEISVANLFFNVPARRKFLRTIETELAHCVEAVTRAALVRPDLDLEVLHEDRSLLRCAPTADWRRRAADLLGPHGEALIPVSFTRGSLEVRALLSPVGVHRAQPTGSTWTYVNGRYVRDLTLRRALTAAYAGIVPKDRYPLVILDIHVPPGDVDVNVHPAKTEVRFAHGFELQNALTNGLRSALQDYGIQRPVASPPRYPAPFAPPSRQISLPGTADPRATEGDRGAPIDTRASAPTSDARPDARWAERRPDEGLAARERPEASTDPLPTATRAGSAPARAVPHEPRADVPDPRGEPRPEVPGLRGERRPDAAGSRDESRHVAEPSPWSSPPAGLAPGPGPTSGPLAALPARPGRATARPLLPVPRFRDLRVIGQLKRTYMLCEGAGELVIIDQHAAAERVTLYRLSCERSTVVGGAQQLLTPHMVRLGANRARALAPAVESLGAWGLDVRFLGGDTFAIHSLPGPLVRADLGALLGDVADELSAGGPATMPQERLDHFLATLACHTSIRAGDLLSVEDMQKLLRDLDDVDFSVCAHGRPVAILIGPEELERRFHR